MYFFYSRTSKAFSNKQTVKQCGCSEVYLDCLQTFLPALSCPLQKEVLRSGVRTFLHRMIICLEEEVLPFIPSASEHMLKDCEAKDLQEFIPLINQITAKFKVWYCISCSTSKCCWYLLFSGSRKITMCQNLISQLVSTFLRLLLGNIVFNHGCRLLESQWLNECSSLISVRILYCF